MIGDNAEQHLLGNAGEEFDDDDHLFEIMATGVAHAFNNVMASVRASLQVARDRLGPDCLPSEIRSIDMVLARGSTLTRSLLTLAHARQDRKRPLYMLDVVEDTLELLEAGLSLRNIVVTRCYSRAPVIHAAQAVVQRAFLRAMLLAAATMHPMFREIRLGFGRGADEPYLELFWTRSDETPRDLEGLGRMFASVEKAVVKGGGQLVIQTSNLGTSVQLHFPLSTSEFRPALPPKKEAVLPNRPLSVLIIDDESVLRRMVASYLVLHGMQVHTAEDGPRGLALIDARGFDVVLLDLVMPGIGGEVVLEQIKKVRPLLPVIVLSGLLDDAMAEKILSQGAWGVIAKPLQLDRLLWLCREAAASRAARPNVTAEMPVAG